MGGDAHAQPDNVRGEFVLAADRAIDQVGAASGGFPAMFGQSRPGQTARVADGSASRMFQYKGRAVVVEYTAPNWKVTVGEKTAESRRLDEALENVLGKSAELVRLSIDVLDWANDV